MYVKYYVQSFISVNVIKKKTELDYVKKYFNRYIFESDLVVCYFYTYFIEITLLFIQFPSKY